MHADAALPEQQDSPFDLHTALRRAADFAFLALQPMGYKLHCETDPEKALKWVYESVVLPDIGELAASSAYKSMSLLPNGSVVSAVLHTQCSIYNLVLSILTTPVTDNVGCCLQYCWTA